MRCKVLAKIALAQVALAVATAVFLRGRNEANVVTNAVFLAGMPSVLYGLWGIVCRLGFFDIVSYSYRRLRAVNAVLRGHGSIPPELTSLLEYTRRRCPNRIPLEHLAAGGAFLLAGIILSWA